MDHARNKKAQALEFGRELLHESIEAMAIMTAVYLIMERPFDWKIVKIGLLLGLLSTAMHAIDEDSHVRIKESMKNAVGNSFVASAIGRVGR